MVRLVEGLDRLARDSALYSDHLKLEDGDARIGVVLSDSGEAATVVIGDSITVVEGLQEPDLQITMEKSIFLDVLEGAADLGALAWTTGPSHVGTIEIELLEIERSAAAAEAMKFMLTFFFTPGRVKVKEIRPELVEEGRRVRLVPLLLRDGVKLAWLTIKKGEGLNDEGGAPDLQAVIVLRGRGTLSFNRMELALRPNTVIYLPRDGDLEFRVEEDMDLIGVSW